MKVLWTSFYTALLMLGALPAMAASITDLKHVVVAEATSQTLLRSGEIDFAASFALNDDMTADMVELGEALDPENLASSPRYAIVLDVFNAKASRRVLNLKSFSSSVFLGFQGAPLSIGPDDPVRGAEGFAATIANAAPQAQYGMAPQAVGPPIIFAYYYDQADVQARRKLSARIYFIDRQLKTYIRTTVDVFEDRRFKIAYRLSARDPRRKAIRKKLDTEQSLDNYERNELLIELSDVLKDLQAKTSEAKPYTSALALRRLIRSEQTKVLEDLEANKFDARSLNDPRFDSVVAIYTGKGSLGSGFYVTPTVIMTNWHVVEGHRFVEMKTYDGAETYGTVLGHDARLDIALVKVERRGRPVAFFTGRGLNPGMAVEAIGHPMHNEFSITRGIVSAIRKHYSINLPKWSGGKDVLFVQTDAAVNPGNSGGPLFLKNRVIGMNTWGRTDSTGMNFSIHYSELINFINEHLIGYNVDPTGRLKGKG
ncbi:MAG: trypsin-like peptidase domain-containing protein [Magnetovibrio sp.]|nr:trypsin-like peptidase domain-containing protein [Magnetovibrio sp.]